MSNEVGSRLREIRQKLRMIQQQLGEKLGINGSAFFPGHFDVMGTACRVGLFPAVQTGEQGPHRERVARLKEDPGNEK